MLFSYMCLRPVGTEVAFAPYLLRAAGPSLGPAPCGPRSLGLKLVHLIGGDPKPVDCKDCGVPEADNYGVLGGSGILRDPGPGEGLVPLSPLTLAELWRRLPGAVLYEGVGEVWGFAGPTPMGIAAVFTAPGGLKVYSLLKGLDELFVEGGLDLVVLLVEVLLGALRGTGGGLNFHLRRPLHRRPLGPRSARG